MSQQPSVGRIVHYVSHGTPLRPDGTQAFTKQCRAATITEVGAWIDDGVVDEVEPTEEHGRSRLVRQAWIADAAGLMVANPTGQFFNQGVLPHLAEEHEQAEGGYTGWSCDGVDHPGGTWHWPGRV